MPRRLSTFYLNNRYGKKKFKAQIPLGPFFLACSLTCDVQAKFMRKQSTKPRSRFRRKSGQILESEKTKISTRKRTFQHIKLEIKSLNPGKVGSGKTMRES